MAFKSYRFRLYPTNEQESMLEQHCGSARWLWNQLLAKNIEQYKETKKFIFRFEMQTSILELKKENEWLKDINSQSLQSVCTHLDRAIKRTFKSNKKRSCFPKFKSKKVTSGSFAVPQNVRIENKYIKLPKIGSIKAKIHRQPIGNLKSATVSKDVDHWYISILFEQMDPTEAQFITSSVGIDLGIKEFAVTSDGEIIKYDHPVKLQKQIKFAQHQFSKKQKGSNRRKKQQFKVAKLHKKQRNKRSDFHHKTSSAIVKHNDLVILEDLNVKGMVKNRKLSKAVSQQGWSAFATMLEQKCISQGKYFQKINRFFPSSKTCSSCGWIQDMPLQERTYNCQCCGHSIDRDLNAAININKEGINQFKIRQELPESKLVEILLVEDDMNFISSKQKSMKREATEAKASW